MPRFMEPAQVDAFDGVILDCRYALLDPAAGERAWREGHIPGAQHLDLGRDLSGPVARHGGRHPLPTPAAFAATMAARGVGLDTAVLLYDDSRHLFAARAWWMLRALGYREPSLLAGGYAAWLAAGGHPACGDERPAAREVPVVGSTWPGTCDRDAIAGLQAAGARLVDAREAARYRGEVEPIDPVAGHIPGAANRPWQGFCAESGGLLPAAEQRAAWGELLEVPTLIVYCGSGVSACVNLLSLAALGHDDARLYPGSWSDWCSYL